MEKMDSTEKELMVLEATKKKLLRRVIIFWLVSSTFLFLRIVLELFGSDPKSFFAAFIYFISGVFLLPFWGIFPQVHNTIEPGKVTLDSPAIIAIFCYTILVIVGLIIIWIVVRNIRTGKQVDKIVQQDKSIDPTKPERIVK